MGSDDEAREQAKEIFDTFDAMTENLGLGPTHFDRQGNPMSMWEYVQAAQDRDGHRVARTEVAGAIVSTVWLGMDVGLRYGGRPLIFETMVFDAETESHAEEFMERYSTEEDALAGHHRVVEALTLREADGADDASP